MGIDRWCPVTVIIQLFIISLPFLVAPAAIDRTLSCDGCMPPSAPPVELYTASQDQMFEFPSVYSSLNLDYTPHLNITTIQLDNPGDELGTSLPNTSFFTISSSTGGGPNDVGFKPHYRCDAKHKAVVKAKQPVDTPNGCGTSSFMRKILPGAALFAPCCNAHDNCFSDCSKGSLEVCNIPFIACLKASCDRAFNANTTADSGKKVLGIKMPVGGLRRAVCYMVRKVYARAVSEKIAQGRFADSTKKMCDCVATNGTAEEEKIKQDEADQRQHLVDDMSANGTLPQIWVPGKNGKRDLDLQSMKTDEGLETVVEDLDEYLDPLGDSDDYMNATEVNHQDGNFEHEQDNSNSNNNHHNSEEHELKTPDARPTDDHETHNRNRSPSSSSLQGHQGVPPPPRDNHVTDHLEGPMNEDILNGEHVDVAAIAKGKEKKEQEEKKRQLLPFGSWNITIDVDEDGKITIDPVTNRSSSPANTDDSSDNNNNNNNKRDARIPARMMHSDSVDKVMKDSDKDCDSDSDAGLKPMTQGGHESPHGHGHGHRYENQNQNQNHKDEDDNNNNEQVTTLPPTGSDLINGDDVAFTPPELPPVRIPHSDRLTAPAAAVEEGGEGPR